MFEFRDLFQWDRFITPTIIKTFYWLVIALICLFGISGIFSGLAAMAISPFGGFILLLSSIASVVVGIVFSRIAAEFVLIVFRINEHLGAIRDQGRGIEATSGAPVILRSAACARASKDRRSAVIHGGTKTDCSLLYQRERRRSRCRGMTLWRQY